MRAIYGLPSFPSAPHLRRGAHPCSALDLLTLFLDAACAVVPGKFPCRIPRTVRQSPQYAFLMRIGATDTICFMGLTKAPPPP